MNTRPGNTRVGRCTLCLTCMNSVLRVDQPWRCAVDDASPITPWDCHHHVKRFRQIPIVERRRAPRRPGAGSRPAKQERAE